ncbi:hypothetical protein [Deinococcus radiotolerans]|uniref:Uncharacterized protein n=1 Tax=Deinococcus radiotolerans TaxID=1309407 RepID=A0ABQ2FNE8_9DEIO|nr:hypothetical protein [Deinococcus radiotolerans]GGL11198.1 hypothetical protein GCM10010844_32300 [Deinococcus radiotolerans]
MSLSAQPFAATTTEPLIPLMMNRYGWTARVCRDRITVLRQTVLKHKRDGFTQPGKVWMVTAYAWSTVQSYLDGYDADRWLTFRAYLTDQYGADEQPPELADVIEELRSTHAAQVKVNEQLLEINRNFQETLEGVTRRLGVIENLLRALPEEIDAALDERRAAGDKRGESTRDVVEDVRDGLRLIGQALSNRS